MKKKTGKKVWLLILGLPMLVLALAAYLDRRAYYDV